MSEEEGEAIQVFVRIRPLNKREIAENQTIGWNFNETSMIEDTPNGHKSYTFDRCFGPEENNNVIYERVGKNVVIKAMEGYNGTVFTYGQTGSGKTFTMRGSDDDPGMMILCIRDIFDYIESHSRTKFTIHVSYMEVYNEEINDLLGEAAKNLPIVSEDAIRGAKIRGLTEELVTNGVELLEVLRRGEHNRSYGSTSMNAESSRSHTIYRLQIESEDLDDDEDSVTQPTDPSTPGGVTRLSFLNLVDLAGSERQKSTNATGKTLKEGANINKSLLTLGAVINKLGEASKNKGKGSKPVYLPYRDSKLTRILKQSLGGNTMTSILCTVTPAPMHREETVSTLKFGQTCKTIKNNVKSNEIVDEKTLIRQYKTIIQELRQELEEYQNGINTDEVIQKYIREKEENELKIKELEEIIFQFSKNSNTASSSSSSVSTSSTTNSSNSNDSNDKSTNEDNILLFNKVNTLTQELAKSQKYSNTLLDSLNECKKVIKSNKTEIYNLESKIEELQLKVNEINNLEELRQNFEEYSINTQQQFDQERAKIDKEKNFLTSERSKYLAEKTLLDEKEGRLGLLLTALDERESKLRQQLNILKEQQGHWQQSISDLTHREKLAEDWQQNHRQREKKLAEGNEQLEKKSQEITLRENNLSELEHNFKIQQRNFSEREQRLQVALSRVANSEQTLNALKEKLTSQESFLHVRECEIEVKDREIQLRRRELEQWDTILRDKDNKIITDQKYLEEKEELLQKQENKLRSRELDVEKKTNELRIKESEATILIEKYNLLKIELENKEKNYVENQIKINNLSSKLLSKESFLNTKENELNNLEAKLSKLTEKEVEINNKINELNKNKNNFYNYEVKNITMRHCNEIKKLEDIIQQQLEITSNLQSEINKLRDIIQVHENEKLEQKKTINEKNSLIEKYESDIKEFEEEKESLKEQLAEAINKANSVNDKSNNLNNSIDDGDEDDPTFEYSRNPHHNYQSKPKSLIHQLAETQSIIRAVLESNESNFAHLGSRRGSMNGYPSRNGSITDLRFDGYRYSNQMEDHHHHHHHHHHNHNHHNQNNHDNNNLNVNSQIPNSSMKVNEDDQYRQGRKTSILVNTNKPFDSKRNPSISINPNTDTFVSTATTTATTTATIIHENEEIITSEDRRKSLTENVRASIASTSNLSFSEIEQKSHSTNSQIKITPKISKNVKISNTTTNMNITPKRSSTNQNSTGIPTTATVVSLDLSKSFRTPNQTKKTITINKLTK